MGKGGSPPAPTPPAETGKSEWGSDVASAGFGMQHGTPNQFSPAGSVTFDKYNLPDVNLGPDKFGNAQIVPGGEGISGVHTSFSPQFQEVFNTLTSKGQGLAGLLPSGGFNPNIDTAALRQAYVHEGLGNVQPVWDREDNQFNTLMAERGIPIGSEIWDDQRNQISEARNQYVEGLTDQAHQAAAADESRQFQQAIAEHQMPFNDFANFYNAVQGMQAGLQGRDAPLITAQAPNVDMAGITRAYDQQRYNNWAASQQDWGGIAGGIGGLLGGLAKMPFMSDEDTKENIKRVGETDDGQPIYQYNYKGEPPGAVRMGLLAQAVEKKHPEAVTEIDGIKHVYYGEALKDAASKKKKA